MKYLLILLLIISLPCFSQDKMGYGNDPEGADSAGFGTITTWIKSIGEITYTGTLTVGCEFCENNPPSDIGCDGYNYGSFDPVSLIGLVWGWGFDPETYDTVKWLSVLDPRIEFTDTISAIDTIMINDLKFTGFVHEYLGIWNIYGLDNPFPAVGQTCSIEIKYTLP